MGKSVAQLKGELRDTLVEMRDLAVKAEGEGRGFTAAEQARVKTLQQQAAQLKEKMGDTQLRSEMAELGRSIGLVDSVGSSGGWARGEPGSWAKAVDANLKHVYGSKALVPSGTVTVPSLSSTVERTPDRPTSLLEIIPTEGLEGSDQYAYLRETVRTHNAAPVAPGTAKPTSV